MDPVDFTRYPSRECQMQFLRMHLEATARYQGDEESSVSDVEVGKLYVSVQKFALVSCRQGC